MTPRLIFVYNANAGIAAGVMDSIHKTLSPATYECALCAVTHGIFSMNKQWRDYLKSLPFEAVFHHRPDFRESWPDHADWPLPLIALERDGALELILGAKELDAAKSVDALIAAMDAKLRSSASPSP